MRDKNLIASVALFSELYNSESYKSIPDIIAEFIRGAVIYENKFSFNSTELKDILAKVYGFEIPESVVRTTLQNKFKDEIVRKDNYFHFNESIKTKFSEIKKEFEEINKIQNSILNELYTFISRKLRVILTEKDQTEIFENFTHFLMDNGYSDRYSNLISAFVISKEFDTGFKDNLNLIKEGLILYQGINYTADINQLGIWNTDITIYLGTEHLFNALGYNGILYQEIFDDFYKLVTEINQSHRNKNGNNQKRNKIELRYFEETKEEIDNFFITAESIKRGKKPLDPSKLAMETILKNCENLSDIKAKRTRFDLELSYKGILLKEFDYSLDKIKDYNVEDLSVLEELKNKSKENNRTFDEKQCRQYFRIFTKINTLRRGVNNNKFEKCGHIFVTETSFAKFLAHNSLVKFDNYDIPFSKDIDFITTRFWFTLKKGFSKKQTLPKSFDIVTKAKIILSSHINNSVSKGYELLLKEKKQGILSDEEALARSYALRSKPNAPEEITIDTLDTTIDFLQNENHLEDFYREKVRKEQLLESKQKENEELQEKLNSFYQKEEFEKKQQRNEFIEYQRDSYIREQWQILKKKNNRDLLFLLLIVSLNIILITSGILISISKDIKEWFVKFEFVQCSLIALYVAIILFDTLGSKYLFNKDQLKNGWVWLMCFLNYSEFKETKENEFKEEYTIDE